MLKLSACYGNTAEWTTLDLIEGFTRAEEDDLFISGASNARNGTLLCVSAEHHDTFRVAVEGVPRKVCWPQALPSLLSRFFWNSGPVEFWANTQDFEGLVNISCVGVTPDSPTHRALERVVLGIVEDVTPLIQEESYVKFLRKWCAIEGDRTGAQPALGQCTYAVDLRVEARPDPAWHCLQAALHAVGRKDINATRNNLVAAREYAVRAWAILAYAQGDRRSSLDSFKKYADLVRREIAFPEVLLRVAKAGSTE